MEEQEIIDLLWQRKEEGLTALQENFKAYCGKIASQVLSQREDVEECLNDTWLKAWQAIPPERPQFLRAYLGKIVKNTSINKLKMLKAKKRISEGFTESIEELGEDLHFSSDNVEEHVNQQALVDALNQFLEKQKKETRVFFVRRYFYHDEIQEIAKAFQVTESKVKVSLHRTRQALAKYLKDEGIA